MIKKGFKYKIKFPKFVKNFFICSVSGKGRDGQYRYYSIMTNDVEGLEDITELEEIEIVEIEGVAQSEYNDKVQVTVFAKIKRIVYAEEEDEGGTLEIDEDDLPF